MTDHDTTDRPGGRQPLRIGDAERQRMIDTLKEHVSAGRLDMGEYERRVEHATGAVFARDLEGLLDDLPRLDDDPVEGAGRRGRGRSDARRDDDPGWWPPAGGRGRPPWAVGPRGRGFAVPGPMLLVGAIALVALTHGWILFPLLFVFLARGGGWCSGPRHRGHGHERGHHRSDRRHDPGRHASQAWHGTGADRGSDVWDEPVDDRPSWPGRYDPDRDDQRM